MEEAQELLVEVPEVRFEHEEKGCVHLIRLLSPQIVSLKVSRDQENT